MQKDLIITLEEECVDCPKLQLETIRNPMFAVHRCVNEEFCRQIVRNLKAHGWKREEDGG